MENKKKEPLVVTIIMGVVTVVFGIGLVVRVIGENLIFRIKEMPQKLASYKEKGIDIWYKYVLKKKRPTPTLSTEEYVELIKDEVFPALAPQEMVDILASYGTSITNVKLPDTVSKEDMCRLQKLGLNMGLIYAQASHEVVSKIKNLEVNPDIIFQREYAKNTSTRRQALLLDETLEAIRKVKPDTIEYEISEEEKEAITKEKVYGVLNNALTAMIELAAAHFPAAASLAGWKSALVKYGEMVGKPINTDEINQ
ncbi:MAG: hypothetical protein IKU39_04630 [Lachnospiraceae bacterium]|nr:hypothetical protein [Lachnospiraceae bacterium]